MKLILFDIDGTLVHVDSDVTRGALRDVVARGLGHHDDLGEVELHGKTDRQIILELCTQLGCDDADAPARCEIMQELLMDYWRRHLTPETVQLLPGVRDLLERLHPMENVRLALLTGNLETGARLKLAPHDLNRFFPLGSFGCDAIQRNDLPPIALQRATSMWGGPFTFERTLIVGDSHRDITCAQAWGIRSLAVATGVVTADVLRSYNPDALSESLLDSDYIFEFIESD